MEAIRYYSRNRGLPSVSFNHALIQGLAFCLQKFREKNCAMPGDYKKFKQFLLEKFGGFKNAETGLA